MNALLNYLSKITKVLKHIIAEVLIVFILILIINNYFKNSQETIVADGRGYYDYLPSTFIFEDLNRKDFKKDENDSLYKRIQGPRLWMNYSKYKGKLVNKYAAGTSLLQSPFFAYTLLKEKKNNPALTGYERPFHLAIFYSTIFYLFLALLFFKKLLLLYKLRRSTIFLAQLLLVLSTPIAYYSSGEPSYSHIYSLFAATVLFYITKKYFLRHTKGGIIWIIAILGLVCLIRQANLLLVFALPFLADSFNQLKSAIGFTFKNSKAAVIGLLLFMLINSLQAYLWYLQVGEFIVYSYGDESFDFSNPHFFEILFSYRKGLFVYTPILFVSMVSSIYFLVNKKYYHFVTWLGFFLGISYFLSSWWSWFFGCSFGHRAFIDFMAILFIPFAILIDQCKIRLKILLLIVSLSTIPINLIQTYQYKYFILHWIEMDKEKYWKVFLKTDPKYRGLVWKDSVDISKYKTEAVFNKEEVIIKKHEFNRLFEFNSDSIQNFNQVSVIRINIADEFPESSETNIILSIKENEESKYWHKVNTIQFAADDFGKNQIGQYDFKIDVQAQPFKCISVIVETEKKADTLNDLEIKFLSRIW